MAPEHKILTNNEMMGIDNYLMDEMISVNLKLDLNELNILKHNVNPFEETDCKWKNNNVMMEI